MEFNVCLNAICFIIAYTSNITRDWLVCWKILLNVHLLHGWSNNIMCLKLHVNGLVECLSPFDLLLNWKTNGLLKWPQSKHRWCWNNSLCNESCICYYNNKSNTVVNKLKTATTRTRNILLKCTYSKNPFYYIFRLV